MKTTFAIPVGLAITAALFAFQTPAKQKEESCCGNMSAMQHENHHADKPVIAKEVNGIQKATVNIENGAYSPAAIQVKKGKPVELTFKGGQKLGCAGTVVFKSLKVRKDVATGKSAVVMFTPKQAGEIEFTCSMGMVKGKVIVK